MVFKIYSKWIGGLVCTLGLVAGGAWAQVPAVQVEAAWARATVPGQKGTGAFMNLTAAQGLRLVGVSSPVAGVAEVHEMKMEGEVMRMRAVPFLELPAGKKVELRPGSYHLMLMDLKQALVKDTRIPLTLSLQNAQGQISQVQLSISVGLQAPSGTPVAPGHGSAHRH
jgi:copper(I)-binding protein